MILQEAAEDSEGKRWRVIRADVVVRIKKRGDPRELDDENEIANLIRNRRQADGSGEDDMDSGGYSMGSGGDDMGSGGYSMGSGEDGMGSGGYSMGSGGDDMGSGGYSMGSGGDDMGSGGDDMGSGEYQ